MCTGPYHLEAADLEWRGATPVSTQFGDVYFSLEGGIEETAHVFLRGNNLPEAWAERRTFTIGELGFGTGLNFLAAWKLWCESAKESGAVLHFISFEKHPLRPEDHARALGALRTLEPYSTLLLDALPDRVPGMHRRVFSHGSVLLTLVYGDAEDCLPQLSPATVDAWFLDGFAPSKNPTLWGVRLFKALRKASREGATCSTYSTARVVKDGLRAAGFSIERAPGFGRKREMLRGVLGAPAGRGRNERRGIKVAVLGAGLAGSAAAYFLSLRGCSVSVLEQHERIAPAASGNPAGIIMPYPTRSLTPAARFYLSCVGFTGHVLSLLRAEGKTVTGEQCGVIRLAVTPQLRKLHEAFASLGIPGDVAQALSAEEASVVAGVTLSEPAIYFPAGGWVAPAALCASLLSSPSIAVRTGVRAARLLPPDGSSARWQILGEGGAVLEEADEVVLANSTDADSLLGGGLRFEKVRGQLCYAERTSRSTALRAVLCHEGYVLPAPDSSAVGDSLGGSLHVVGATYDHGNESEQVDEAQSRLLLERAGRTSPELLGLRPHGGRVGFRMTTPDRLPLLGRMIPEALRTPLYVSLGHGSRGLLSCLLGGELIACQMLDEPAPLEARVLAAVAADRFQAAGEKIV